MKISTDGESHGIDSRGAFAWAVCSGRCACSHAARVWCAGCLHAVCETCAQVIRGRSGDQSFCPECRILDFSVSEAEAVGAAAVELDRLGCFCGDAGWLHDKIEGRVYFVTILGTRRCPMRATTITAATKAGAYRKALRRARALTIVRARRQRPRLVL